MSAGGHYETRPVNIYVLSRIREEVPFNLVERHSARKRELQRTKFHEIESLRLLADALADSGLPVSAFDGFFFSFHIPRIGKEFDLLRLTDRLCLNVELKSVAVPREQILAQLRKNRHYLSHLGRELLLYTVVTDTMTCYRLSGKGELEPADFRELREAVVLTQAGHLTHIDDLFRASDYLVSPLSTPDRFIRGEYFLTQAQEQVKKSVLAGVEEARSGAFFHITGTPGTGKTLLLYDLARTLSGTGRTAILHCGELTPGQERIRQELRDLEIVSDARLREDGDLLSAYRSVLVDESHRLAPELFRAVCRSARLGGQVCIFSSDPGQVLTAAQERWDIPGRIDALPPAGRYVLSEKLRMNRELSDFIRCLKNRNYRPKQAMDYSCVELDWANTTREAQDLLEYHRSRGFVCINYTRTGSGPDPFADYAEDFDAHHVIGQEFDKVVMLMDGSFSYDETGALRGIPDPEYLYPNLFYQSVTRVREQLALIVVNAPELFGQIVTILAPEEQ